LAKETASGPVVTGLSLPMLVAVCQRRSQDADLAALAGLAISSGQQAIRLL
jgi:mannose/fructose-specific phosphotransferase system component IIA